MASILSAGTTTSTAMVHIADTSGVLQLASNNGTTAVTIDASQRIAIGTSTANASAITTIKQTSSAYQLQLEQSNVTDGYGIRCNAADGALTFSRYASGTYTERVRFDASGNLLVGTTSNTFSGQPINGIGVAAAAAALIALNNTNNTNQSWHHWIYDSGLGSAGTYSIGQVINGSSSGVAGGPFTPILNMAVPSAASNSPKVYIDGSGNVGIGTTSPIYPLHIGTAAAASSAISGIALRQGSGSPTAGNGYRVAWDNTQNVSNDFGSIFYGFGGASAASVGYMAFSTANAERMRIDGNGNVGIGTTSPVRRLTVAYPGSAEFVLQDTTQAANSRNWRIYNGSNSLVMGTLNDAGTAGNDYLKINSSGQFFVSANGSSNPGMSVDPSGYMGLGNSAGSSGFGFITFYRSGSNIGNITQNGTTAVAYNTSSDYRLKENIAPMTGALAKVAALKPCTYTWKSAPEETGEGFIAHELAEVCPQAVHGTKDAVDADGNPVYQGIDTSFLVATLTAAIQELKAEFDAYKASHP